MRPRDVAAWWRALATLAGVRVESLGDMPAAEVIARIRNRCVS